MISDTLADASAEIRRYLTEPAFVGCYADPRVQRVIRRLLREIDVVRKAIDVDCLPMADAVWDALDARPPLSRRDLRPVRNLLCMIYREARRQRSAGAEP